MRYPLKNNKGDFVGHFETSTGVVYKRLYENPHMLKIPKAWCYDRSIIDDIKQVVDSIAGMTMNHLTFVIEAQDTGKIYKLPWSTFNSKCWELDRSHGKQLAVALHEWKREDSNSRQLSLFS